MAQQDAAQARKAKRQSRMSALKSRRGASGAKVSGSASSGDDDPLGQGAGPDAAAKRQALKRVYKMLTETEEDSRGKIEGTPFSHAGLDQLTGQLRERAAKEGQKGARVAQGLLNFLAPKDGEDSVNGVSREKITRLATMVEARQARRAERAQTN